MLSVWQCRTHQMLLFDFFSVMWKKLSRKNGDSSPVGIPQFSNSTGPNCIDWLDHLYIAVYNVPQVPQKSIKIVLSHLKNTKNNDKYQKPPDASITTPFGYTFFSKNSKTPPTVWFFFKFDKFPRCRWAAATVRYAGLVSYLLYKTLALAELTKTSNTVGSFASQKWNFSYGRTSL